MKFDKNGKFIKTWGLRGTAIPNMNTVHALAFDSQGRLFVGDRQNNRIQIFDQEGTFLASWTQFGRPSGIYIDRHDTMYVADSESHVNQDARIDETLGYGYNPGCKRGIRIGSAKDGMVKYFIPDPKPYPATMYHPTTNEPGAGPEGVAADDKGNVYGAAGCLDGVCGGLTKYVLAKR
jgi:hypothetical protein